MTKAKFSKVHGILPVNAYTEFPDDAIDIPDDLYRAFLDGAISGFDVVAGQVVAITPAAPNPNAERISEIDERLFQIDMESIRPTRTLRLDPESEFDLNKLEQLEAEAEALRDERRDFTA